MREIISADPMPTAKFPSAWLVRFQDTSVVGVNAAGYYESDVAEHVRNAAIRYSKANRQGVLQSVMVNLTGVAEK